MGRIRQNKQYIVPGALISASYVSDLYDLLTANMYEDTSLSGSLSVTGSIYGNLIGTASFVTQASQSFSASYANTAKTASYANTTTSASYANTATSASYSVTASYLAAPGMLVISGSAYFNLGTMPTVDPGIPGKVWRSGSFVMVSLG